MRQGCWGPLGPRPWERAGKAPVPYAWHGWGPCVLTGSPPDAKDIDCMWWLAMICKVESLLDTARNFLSPTQGWHILLLPGLTCHGGSKSSRALVMSHRPPGKGLGHHQEWGQNQEIWPQARGLGSYHLQERSRKAQGIFFPPLQPQGLRGGGHSSHSPPRHSLGRLGASPAPVRPGVWYMRIHLPVQSQPKPSPLSPACSLKP